MADPTDRGGADDTGRDDSVEEDAGHDDSGQEDACRDDTGGNDGHGPSVSVAVVDAETPGNVGTIARAMKNFGFSELLLVDPPALDPQGEAYGFAGRAREDVLPNAREVAFDELVDSYHTVGTTAVTNEDETSHVRYPFSTPAELAAGLRGVAADTCVVFGRERVGLTNDELARLDEVCSIPASAEYPVLNLGQAATVVLYELRPLTIGGPDRSGEGRSGEGRSGEGRSGEGRSGGGRPADGTQHPDTRHQRAAEHEVEGLHDQFAAFLRAVDHPPEKRAKAERLWRRFVGRAHPTGREATTIRGLLRRATQRLDDDGE